MFQEAFCVIYAVLVHQDAVISRGGNAHATTSIMKVAMKRNEVPCAILPTMPHYPRCTQVEPAGTAYCGFID